MTPVDVAKKARQMAAWPKKEAPSSTASSRPPMGEAKAVAMPGEENGESDGVESAWWARPLLLFLASFHFTCRRPDEDKVAVLRVRPEVPAPLARGHRHARRVRGGPAAPLDQRLGDA